MPHSFDEYNASPMVKDKISSNISALLNGEIDHILWGAFSLIIMFGSVMVLSATVYYSQTHFNLPAVMALRQWSVLFFGLLLFWFISKIPLDIWRTLRWPIFIIGLTMLILVLIPGIGVEIKGSRRWLNLPGFSFQPSEYMKFAFIIFMAGYIEKFSVVMRRDWHNTLKVVTLPMALVLLLLFFEPDAGAMAGMLFIVMGMMFFAGANLIGYAILSTGVVGLLFSLIFFTEYRLQRWLTFLDPWAHKEGAGYQVSNSLMAISEGGWFGVGLGNSVQKTGFLPDQHSDFIIAVIIEEVGFIGFCIVLSLYLTILWRLFAMVIRAWKVKALFLGSLPLGLGLWILFQIIVNIGSAFGLLPPKGLILPLISHGGSNLLMMCITFGLVLRADIELRRLL